MPKRKVDSKQSKSKSKQESEDLNKPKFELIEVTNFHWAIDPTGFQEGMKLRERFEMKFAMSKDLSFIVVMLLLFVEKNDNGESPTFSCGVANVYKSNQSNAPNVDKFVLSSLLGVEVVYKMIDRAKNILQGVIVSRTLGTPMEGYIIADFNVDDVQKSIDLTEVVPI